MTATRLYIYRKGQSHLAQQIMTHRNLNKQNTLPPAFPPRSVEGELLQLKKHYINSDFIIWRALHPVVHWTNISEVFINSHLSDQGMPKILEGINKLRHIHTKHTVSSEHEQSIVICNHLYKPHTHNAGPGSETLKNRQCKFPLMFKHRPK